MYAYVSTSGKVEDKRVYGSAIFMSWFERNTLP